MSFSNTLPFEGETNSAIAPPLEFGVAVGTIGVGVFVGNGVEVAAGNAVGVLVGNEVGVLVGTPVDVAVGRGVAVFVGDGSGVSVTVVEGSAALNS